MTEPTGGGSRAAVERRLIDRSLEDEEFRQRLLDDPKGTLEQELERELPEGVQVRAVEETKDTIYLVLPSASALGGQGGDLSDEALEAVSGGGPALTSVLGVFTCGGRAGISRRVAPRNATAIALTSSDDHPKIRSAPRIQ